MISASYRSASQRTATDVSRPPEYASTIRFIVANSTFLQASIVSARQVPKLPITELLPLIQHSALSIHQLQRSR
jgi:hypothetical protein